MITRRQALAMCVDPHFDELFVHHIRACELVKKKSKKYGVHSEVWTVERVAREFKNLKGERSDNHS